MEWTKGLMRVFSNGFGHVDRMENDRIVKSVYVGVCTGSHSMGRPWKRWIDTVKDCLKKRGLDIKQTRSE